MKFLKSFFKFTRIFFIISQLVLGLIFAYSAIFLLEAPELSDYFSAAFFLLLALSLLWSFYAGLFRGGANKYIRILTGSILIILALMLSYATFSVFGFADASIILFVPFWLLSAGLYELLGRSKTDVPAKSVPVVDSPLE